MLGLNGSIALWYIDNITDMRLGKYRLFEIVKNKFPNPYNGDAFSFLSKSRRTLKIVRYDKAADIHRQNDLSPVDYLTHVFRQLMEGNKDYKSLLSNNLALQTI